MWNNDTYNTYDGVIKWLKVCLALFDSAKLLTTILRPSLVTTDITSVKW